MDKAENNIDIRPFPYPFDAGLAICSDIDDCDRNLFIKVHQFLNVDLGLPVADSFFGRGRKPGQMAFFDFDGKTPTKDAPFILQAIADGLIDGIHTWGDFNKRPPDPRLLRRLAENQVKAIQDEGLDIRIWINHGESGNRQNMKVRIAPDLYLGDDPSSDYYTADLARSLGIEYFWLSEILYRPLSIRRKLIRRKSYIQINRLKNKVKRILGKGDRIRKTDSFIQLAAVETLRDGSGIFGFNRFCRPSDKSAPTRDTLKESLHPSILKKLVQQHGSLILYTHFGHPAGKNGGGTPFTAANQEALKRLSERYHGGEIWVATTLDLLRYWRVRKYLQWKHYEEGDVTVVEITGIDDPIEGFRAPDPAELAGICFYCRQPEKTVLRLENTPLPAQIYAPDRNGMPSIGFDPPPAPKDDLLKRR